MKKILILSYFFPPSNFAGSYRIASFAKYLHKFGFYPVVITRQSPKGASTFREMAAPCGKDVIHEVNEGYEVYYLPYRANLRDRLLFSYGEKKLSFLRKALSLFEMLTQFITPFFISYSNIYFFSKRILTEQPDFTFIMASGKPFQLFLFAHKLSAKYHIPWVADYRDEWNSRYLFNAFPIPFKDKIYYFFEKELERKFCSSAALITTVTQEWVTHIRTFNQKECRLVLNGYDDVIEKCALEKTFRNNSDSLNILHLGSLYVWQPIEIFLKGVVLCLNKGKSIKCFFPGILNEPSNKARIFEEIKGHETHFNVSERIDRIEAIKMMQDADAFLMVGYQDFSGWMSLKLLEYLPFYKPIILCPGNATLEAFLKPYSNLHVCNSSEEVKLLLDSHKFLNKSNNAANQNDINFVAGFSRMKQTEKLAQLLNSIKPKS